MMVSPSVAVLTPKRRFPKKVEMGRADVTGGAASDTGKRTSARCPRCYDSFPCGATAGSCWCQTLPPLGLSPQPPDLVGKGCLCAACLRAALRANRADCTE